VPKLLLLPCTRALFSSGVPVRSGLFLGDPKGSEGAGLGLFPTEGGEGSFELETANPGRAWGASNRGRAAGLLPEERTARPAYYSPARAQVLRNGAEGCREFADFPGAGSNWNPLWKRGPGRGPQGTRVAPARAVPARARSHSARRVMGQLQKDSPGDRPGLRIIEEQCTQRINADPERLFRLRWLFFAESPAKRNVFLG
jgi:hypothetical protein